MTIEDIKEIFDFLNRVGFQKSLRCVRDHFLVYETLKRSILKLSKISFKQELYDQICL